MTPKQQKIREEIVAKFYYLFAEDWIATFEWSEDDSDTLQSVEAKFDEDMRFGWDGEWDEMELDDNDAM
jgi:hypothetical protein